MKLNVSAEVHEGIHTQVNDPAEHFDATRNDMVDEPTSTEADESTIAEVVESTSAKGDKAKNADKIQIEAA